MYDDQLYEYFDMILSNSQCGFRKGYSTQHTLLVMVEKFREALDNGKEFGALLTDLSKAFDCIYTDHNLLISKLHSYGVSLQSLNLVFSYLTNRKKKKKINDNFSSESGLLFRVPQGSIYIYIIYIQYNPDNSNLQGTMKIVRVSECSSYRGIR